MRKLFLITAAVCLSACNINTDLSEPGASQPPITGQGVTDPNDPRIAGQGVIDHGILGLTPDAPTLPTGTLEDIDFNDYSKGLAKFTGLKEGQSRGEAVDNVRLYFAPEGGSTIISTSQSAFEREDGAVLLFSARGLPDDSVKAEEIYLILSGLKGEQTLAAYGSRIKCHRGKNTTEWQTALCP